MNWHVKLRSYAATAIIVLACNPEPVPAQNIEQSSAPSAYITGSKQCDPAELLRFAAEHVIAVREEPTAQNLANSISPIYREDGVTLAETTYRTDTQTGNIEFLH